MSAKSILKVSNVKAARKTSKTNSRARISSECISPVEHKSCGRREDPAVEAMQEAGAELSDIFKQLKDERTAAKLVRAIRCRDARAVQSLIDCHCRVVNFFSTRDKDCVRIFCAFGRNQDVTVSFDICVKREVDECRRQFW
ncbi:hypothetical protein [Paenibacillus sp. NRS-1760]|uniref:hypothetical protein n=1 Tax=Paenibacillus sp. NRS-1760 TaxID=3233902 RepID=UPI003D29CBA0